MTHRHLPQLVGTNYRAEVFRKDGDLYLRVERPARGSENVMELIGERFLGRAPTERDRDRVIAEIINTDTADIVGVYTGEAETE